MYQTLFCFAFHFAAISRDHTRQMVVRWKPNFILVDDMDIVHKLDGGESVRRYASSIISIHMYDTFGVCGMDRNGEDISLLIVSKSPTNHTLQSILWGPVARKKKYVTLKGFLEWYSRTFKYLKITLGDSLEPDDELILCSLIQSQ